MHYVCIRFCYLFCYLFNETIKVIEGEQKVTLDDVILSDEIKEELCMICNDISQEKKVMFEKVGFKPPQGYLLYGPSGNGKTLLARAVAGEAKIPFFSISGADIVRPFVVQGAQENTQIFSNSKKKASLCNFYR